MRRALAAALAALALLPATASAHALLEATTPERGARLDAAPEQVTHALQRAGRDRVRRRPRVRLATGRRSRRARRSTRTTTRRRSASGSATGSTEDGYTVTYRVISADSHPISGGFVFVVGDGAAPATTVGELLGDSETGPVTGTAFGVARAVQFAAIALALGTVIFALWCWLPALRAGWEPAALAFAGRQRLLLRVAAIAGVLSGAAAIVFQGAVAAGSTFWAALDADVIGDVLGTRFGAVLDGGLVAWLLVLVLAGHVRRARGPGGGAVGAARARRPRERAVAGRAPAPRQRAPRTGHGRLARRRRRARARRPGSDRARSTAPSARACSPPSSPASRRSPGSPSPSSWRPGSRRASWRSAPSRTSWRRAFGRAVLIKIVLFAGIVALGAVNRRRHLPALTSAAREGGVARPRRAAPAPHAARRAGARDRRPGRHRGARRLRAVDRREHRSVLRRRRHRAGADGDDRRPGAGRPERDPPVPVRPKRREPVRRDRGADRHRGAAREADRPRSSSTRRRPVRVTMLCPGQHSAWRANGRSRSPRA